MVYVMVLVEIRYLDIKKSALALFISSKKLYPYFQAHMIVVITSDLLCQVLCKPYISGRLTRWLVKLGEFEIKYQS